MSKTYVANRFNSYFKSVSHSASVDSNVSSNNNQQYKHTHYLKFQIYHHFSFSHFTEHELIEISKSLNNTNSTGFENISFTVVKQIIHVIVKPLVHIFNVSF